MNSHAQKVFNELSSELKNEHYENDAHYVGNFSKLNTLYNGCKGRLWWNLNYLRKGIELSAVQHFVKSALISTKQHHYLSNEIQFVNAIGDLHLCDDIWLEVLDHLIRDNSGMLTVLSQCSKRFNRLVSLILKRYDYLNRGSLFWLRSRSMRDSIYISSGSIFNNGVSIVDAKFLCPISPAAAGSGFTVGITDGECSKRGFDYRDLYLCNPMLLEPEFESIVHESCKFVRTFRTKNRKSFALGVFPANGGLDEGFGLNGAYVPIWCEWMPICSYVDIKVRLDELCRYRDFVYIPFSSPENLKMKLRFLCTFDWKTLFNNFITRDVPVIVSPSFGLTNRIPGNCLSDRVGQKQVSVRARFISGNVYLDALKLARGFVWNTDLYTQLIDDAPLREFIQTHLGCANVGKQVTIVRSRHTRICGTKRDFIVDVLSHDPGITKQKDERGVVLLNFESGVD